MTATQELEKITKRFELGNAGGKLADVWEDILKLAAREYESELEEIGYSKTQRIQATLDALNSK